MEEEEEEQCAQAEEEAGPAEPVSNLHRKVLALVREGPKINAYAALKRVGWTGESIADAIDVMLAFHPKQENEPARMKVPEYNRMTHEIVGDILEKIEETGKVTRLQRRSLWRLLKCNQLLMSERVFVWKRLCDIFRETKERITAMHYFTGILKPELSASDQEGLDHYQAALLEHSAGFVCEHVGPSLKELQITVRVLKMLPPVHYDQDFYNVGDNEDEAQPAGPKEKAPAVEEEATQPMDGEPEAKRQRTA